MVSAEEIKELPFLTKEKVVAASENIYSEEDIPYYTLTQAGVAEKL